MAKRLILVMLALYTTSTTEVFAGPNEADRKSTDRTRRTGAVGLAVLLLLGGCAAAEVSRVEIPIPSNPDVLGFSRVLVAGFVPDGIDEIDVNEETARFLRTRLRSRGSIRVIESEPLRLGDMSSPNASGSQALGATFRADGNRPQDPQPGGAVFTNAPFWKKLGEEYSEPLIVTGTVAFKSAAPRYAERTVGRQTMRLWRRGFSLRLHLVLISGKTGEIVDSVPLHQLVAHATTAREGALSLHFKLMDRMMPSILGAIGQATSQARVLLK